jgi:hypothetical protein
MYAPARELRKATYVYMAPTSDMQKTRYNIYVLDEIAYLNLVETSGCAGHQT